MMLIIKTLPVFMGRVQKGFVAKSFERPSEERTGQMNNLVS
jgi:hypothetical protein